MSKRVLASGRFENGTVRFKKREHFDAWLKREFREGEDVMVTVQKSTRTLRQNALLWLYNTMIGRELGWTPEAVHEYDKGRINPEHLTRTNPKTGELIEVSVPRTTHDMPLDEFTEMLDEKKRLWAEEGYILPDPNDMDF